MIRPVVAPSVRPSGSWVSASDVRDEQGEMCRDRRHCWPNSAFFGGQDIERIPLVSGETGAEGPAY